MTIIVVPDESCNYRCEYCFEPEAQRNKLHDKIPLNLDAIEKSLHEIWAGPYGGSDVCLHGGEPTLIDRVSFERLLFVIYNLPHRKKDGSYEEGKVKGVVNIVTNGSRIDDYMIELFKKYNVYLSISMDGPPASNILRGPDPSTRGITERYNQDLRSRLIKLRENSIPVSIMCILHKENASLPDHREEMKEWFLWLKSIGITSGRTNPAYFRKDRNTDLELSTEELFEFYKMMYDLNKQEGLRWNPVHEMIENLKGEKVDPCSLAQCDYFNSHTVSIHPDGTVGNCDRTFQDGMYIRSMDRSKSGRYQALQQTQCKGCRYWPVCGGGCPAEGFDDDWRNKTRFCDAIYSMYDFIETELRFFNPDAKLQINVGDQKVDPRIGPQHGDSAHGDSTHVDSNHGDGQHGDLGHMDLIHDDLGHGDMVHGDSVHGDGVHGDMNHGDMAHGDLAHGDISHGDNSHGDIGHGDSNHGDFSDWKEILEDDEDE